MNFKKEEKKGVKNKLLGPNRKAQREEWDTKEPFGMWAIFLNRTLETPFSFILILIFFLIYPYTNKVVHLRILKKKKKRTFRLSRNLLSCHEKKKNRNLPGVQLKLR